MSRPLLRWVPRPFDVFVVILAGALGLAWSLLSEEASHADPQLATAVRAAFMAFAGIALVRLLAFAAVDLAVARGWKRQPSSLLRFLVSGVLYVGLVMAVLKFGLGRDITGLLGASAVVGAVAGFAMQATLDNLFAGVSLQLEQPFRIGDVLRVGEVVGEVEALTWRAVHLRTEERSRVVLPNGVLGGETVEILSGDELVERVVEIDVDPAARPGFVIERLEAVAASVPNVATRPPPEVCMAGLRPGVGTRIYQVQYFPERYLEFESTEARIRRSAWYALDRVGVACGPAAARPPSPPAETEARVELAARALAARPPFSSLSPRACRELAAEGRLLRYSRDESLGADALAEPCLFVVLSGTAARTAPREPGEPDPEDRAVDPAAWTPGELAVIGGRLARHVGPVADLLVRRAARRTVDPHRLHLLLAEEIDDEDARADFCAAMPEHPSRPIEAGALIGLDWVLGRGPLDLDTLRAVTELELLALPRSRVRAALAAVPGAEAPSR